MISEGEARGKAEAFLDIHVRPQMSFEVVVIPSSVEDQGDSWIFPYDGKGWAEEGRTSEAMAGNVPIRVFKQSGETDFDDRD